MSKKLALQAKAVFGELTLREVLDAVKDDCHGIDVYVDGEFYDSYKQWETDKKALYLKQHDETDWSFLLKLKVRFRGNHVELMGRDMGAKEEIKLAFCEPKEIDLKSKIMQLP
jgi:hypothetical protein